MASTGGASVAAATVIVKAAGAWRSDPTPPAGLDDVIRDRDAFWKFTPAGDGMLTFSNDQSQAGDTYLSLFTGPAQATTAGQLTRVAHADDNRAGNHEAISYAVTPGTTYYLVTSAYDSGTVIDAHVLSIEAGPASAGPPAGHTAARLSVPVVVSAAGRYAGPLPVAARLSVALRAAATVRYAGPVLVSATLPAVFGVHGNARAVRRIAVAVPPAVVAADAPAPVTASAVLRPVAPMGLSVPAARPSFTVAVTNDTPGLSVEVQYDMSAAFTAAPVVVAAPAPAGVDDQQVTVQAAGDLADGEWWWRARPAGPYGPGTWTPPALFAVNTAEGRAVAAGGLTVTTGTRAAPHLWYVDTAETGTDIGATGVVIGTGFGTAPQVMLGDIACPVEQVLTVPAYDVPDPGIEPGVRCDPWHQQIRFTVPQVDPDHVGDALSILGGD